MKALRIEIFQKHANYRIPESLDNRMTYNIVPASTVIGTIHSICKWKELHNIKVAISSQYESKTKEYKNLITFLNTTLDDRGCLVKLSNPYCLNSNGIKVSSTLAAKNNSHLKEITTKVHNRVLLEEYKNLHLEKEKLEEEKKIKIEEVDKEIKNLQNIKKNFEKGTEEYKEYEKKEKEIKERKVVLQNELKERKEEIDYKLSFFKLQVVNQTYFEILNNVKTTIYVSSDKENELEEIYENLDEMYCLGRSEDSVEILNAEILNITLPTHSICSKEKMKYYIPYERFSSDSIYTINNQKLSGYLGEAFGTCYQIPTTYTKIDNKRIFNKVKVLMVENFSIDEESENVFYDEKNDDIVCFID